jgi:hypothetical protein
MALENEKLLDETGWQLLHELQQNARLSFSELGQRVGLSSPAVAERVRKMQVSSPAITLKWIWQSWVFRSWPLFA